MDRDAKRICFIDFGVAVRAFGTNGEYAVCNSLTDFNTGVRNVQPDAGAYEWQLLTEKRFVPLVVR